MIDPIIREEKEENSIRNDPPHVEMKSSDGGDELYNVDISPHHSARSHHEIENIPSRLFILIFPLFGSNAPVDPQENRLTKSQLLILN